MRRSRGPLTLGWSVAVLGLTCGLCQLEAWAADPLAEARRLFLTGKYAEASAAYEQMTGSHPLESALGAADCQAAQGQWEDAIQRLNQSQERSESLRSSPQLAARRASYALASGDREQARKDADHALLLDADQLEARWVRAELLRLRGEMSRANQECKWFVDTFNHRSDLKDSEGLRFIGQAASHYARWNGLSDQFHFLVNDFYPGIVKQDPDYWPAHFEAGRLYLEKFNQSEADRSLRAALAINPNAGCVHAALAELALQNFDLPLAQRRLDRALQIAPADVSSLQLQADLCLVQSDIPKAMEWLELARKRDPRSEPTLGRLAACFLALDGDAKSDTSPQRLAQLTAEVLERNPQSGEFFAALGDALDLLRKYPQAAGYYRRAIECLPQLAATQGKLGLTLMRLGDEETASQALRASFAGDPFNVRVSNTLDVLQVLSNYASLETPHFRLRFDRAQDETLARLAAAYLEQEVYPEVCRELGYEPREKTLIEIFSRARNTSGHGWFSARMVGLPHVGTVGACAGKIVAMQSPNDSPRPFNWARVLRHEFVHVVNLQQTDFNIPHWFTEALAVRLERLPRPKMWDELLVERSANRSLFDLKSINSGFARPKSGMDWNLAYCQAELYAEYVAIRFGEDKLRALLAAFAERLSVGQAIEQVFKVDVAEFERGYREYVSTVVDSLPAPSKQVSLASLEADSSRRPDDSDTLAKFAIALLRLERWDRAEQMALRAESVSPRHPLARVVQARLALRAGKMDKAVSLLEQSLSRDKPLAEHLALLAGLQLKAKNYAEAMALYELGAEHFPHDPSWNQSLARTYLLSGEEVKLSAVLSQLAAIDGDDLAVRRKLAQIAGRRQDYAESIRWATESLRIDPRDAEMHRLAAVAHFARQEFTPAISAWQYAKLLDDKDPDVRRELARTLMAAGENTRAAAELKDLLRLEPTHARARESLKTLKP